MGGLVVWLAGPFTNGPYGCFGVLGGVSCGEVGDNLMIVVRLDR